MLTAMAFLRRRKQHRKGGNRMYLEERVSQLEEQNKMLMLQLERLEKGGLTRFVSVKELAEIMHCSVQNVHRKIRNGEIQATRKLGDPRIPMSQFMDADNSQTLKCRQVPKPKKAVGMAEQVFGS
jgi:hypothetical protein